MYSYRFPLAVFMVPVATLLLAVPAVSSADARQSRSELQSYSSQYAAQSGMTLTRRGYRQNLDMAENLLSHDALERLEHRGQRQPQMDELDIGLALNTDFDRARSGLEKQR